MWRHQVILLINEKTQISFNSVIKWSHTHNIKNKSIQYTKKKTTQKGERYNSGIHIPSHWNLESHQNHSATAQQSHHKCLVHFCPTWKALIQYCNIPVLIKLPIPYLSLSGQAFKTIGYFSKQTLLSAFKNLGATFKYIYTCTYVCYSAEELMPCEAIPGCKARKIGVSNQGEPTLLIYSWLNQKSCSKAQCGTQKRQNFNKWYISIYLTHTLDLHGHMFITWFGFFLGGGGVLKFLSLKVDQVNITCNCAYQNSW